MHHWLQALFWSFHVRMVVGRTLIVVEKVYSEVMLVSACWVRVCVCMYGEREIYIYVCMRVGVFTPWPQTGVLKPLWQCVQTAFSLLSPPSISLCHSIHPRTCFKTFTSWFCPCDIFYSQSPNHSSVLSSPNMLLDTPHTPAPSTAPCLPVLPPPLLLILSSWVQVCLINV